jgi:hypothetical protein
MDWLPCGSYGRLEIRVVHRASDRQPFLRTSSHRRVGTSEALSRTHVEINRTRVSPKRKLGQDVSARV